MSTPPRSICRSICLPPEPVPLAHQPEPVPLAHSLANLLEHESVQSIRFSIYGIPITPEGFRSVAAAIRSDTLKVKCDPVALAAGKSSAVAGPLLTGYNGTSNINTFFFASHTALDTAKGRALAVHESCHAICDAAKKNQKLIAEESAAYVAQVWYLLNIGADVSKQPSGFVEVASAMRARATAGGGNVSATKEEAKKVALVVIKLGYKYGFYINDGF